MAGSAGKICGWRNLPEKPHQPQIRRKKTRPHRDKNAAPPKKDAKTFPVDVNQIRLQNAELDFADLSMMLPFGTRIHELSGVINGLSTAPDQRTVMAFEGQVNQYGSVKIKGELAL